MKFCIKQFGLYLFSLVLFAAIGCVSTLPDNNRVSRYRPETSGIPTQKSLVVNNDGNENEKKQVDSNDVSKSDKPVANKTTPTKASDDNAKVTGAEEKTAVPPVAFEHSKLRTLKSGDSVIIHLRSIPHPEEIREVIDGWGEVTLPHIGEVRLANKTVSEAERLIESSYVDGSIYKQINVIVVAEDEVYFVRGEVTRRGKYSLSGDVTLLQAISEAGGFTPFANTRKIQVMRGDEMLIYNGRDISKGKTTDPPIFSDDIIEVMKRVIW